MLFPAVSRGEYKDKFGCTFFIERRTDHKKINGGYGGGQNEALELRLGRGVENEVPPSQNRHDPDDKTGTA